MGSPFIRNCYRTIMVLLAATLTFLPQPASAEVTSVVINSSSPLGEFDGKSYIAVKGTMYGTVDGTIRVYNVPLMYEFPEDPSDCNGFAVAEPLHQGAGPASLAVIGPDYMFGNGYVHAAVGWDNSADANQSKGNTEQLGDAHQVLQDLSSLLRNPSPFLEGPCPVDNIIAFGTSRTGSFWRGFLFSGKNHPLLYDGFLINAAGALRLDLSGGNGTRRHVSYPGPLPEDGSKKIATNNEHDVDLYQGWKVRTETPSYRVYESAGTPHLAIRILNLAGPPWFATRQSPAHHGPVVKAMLRHLHDWISHGTEPPPSVTLPGTGDVDVPLNDRVSMIACTPCTQISCPNPTDILPRCKIYQFIRDDFGNATGGVRLPFMEVPIGTYTGVERTFPNPNAPNAVRELISQGGTFTPFSQDMLNELYPKHGTYVKKIAEAARMARDNDWILGEDVGAYTSEGADLSVGHSFEGP